MRKGEVMPQAARDHIRAKLAACWTPERRQFAREQLKRYRDKRRATRRTK